MADAAQELGLQYLGIADHSKSSFQANGLDEKRLARRRSQRIKRIQRRPATGIHALRRQRVDILKDGSLDFPDEVLAQLDYVRRLASTPRSR